MKTFGQEIEEKNAKVQRDIDSIQALKEEIKQKCLSWFRQELAVLGYDLDSLNMDNIYCYFDNEENTRVEDILQNYTFMYVRFECRPKGYHSLVSANLKYTLIYERITKLISLRNTPLSRFIDEMTDIRRWEKDRNIPETPL